MSKLANISEDLRKAGVLIAKFPSVESIKLHRGQCSRLLEKVMETLDLAEEEDRSFRNLAQYSKVFRELCRVVHRVKTFTDDYCYKRGSDFVLAAIKVSAHKERFIKYYLELDWCIFLIERVRDAKGELVASKKLEGFEWKEKVSLLVEDTRIIVEKDFRDFKDVLRDHVKKPGDYQKICATLLRHFKEEIDLVVDLQVPFDIKRVRQRISRSGFSEVYNFKWKKTESAVKIPSPNSGTLDTEVAILEKCCHPNIVNLILFHKNLDGKQFLMMEKLSMNLLEYLKLVAAGSSVPPLEAVDMILQVCEGMEYLSDTQRVSHRDLKPENILIKLVSGQDGSMLELQVANFGQVKVRAAIELSSSRTLNVGTTMFRAPEMTGAPKPGEDKMRGQDAKADMFSFAVTCSCILTGCKPYEEIISVVGMEGLRKFVKKGGRPTLPADCPDELASLLEEYWHPEPSKRPASFFAICEKLRKLKAMLLTSDVYEGDQAGPSSPKTGRMTFESGVRPLRILVLGDAKLLKATCMSICGALVQLVEDHTLLKESVSISPPMRLYRVATSTADYADSMSFVEVRNKRWRQDNLKASWSHDLSYSSDDVTPFPNRSLRLHMVWYVCERLDDLPDSLQWKDITRKLNGVPLQILVTGTDGYEKILHYKERFGFDNSQLVEESIIKVDLEDSETKDRLWRACWEVKTKAEIKNAATIIGYIREQLGSSGIVSRVGMAASKSRKFSIEQSKEFILNFLFSYWEIPTSFVEVLPSMRNPREATKFLPFCLQVAAIILYWERERLGSVLAEAIAELVLREAQACAEAYFTSLDFDACDKMKSGYIQGFLEAVFENRDVPQPLVSGLDRRWRVSKFNGRLCGKGHGP